MYKLYAAIHGGWWGGMRKVDEIERAIERGFGLHTDDTKTLHSCTHTHTDIFLLLALPSLWSYLKLSVHY